MFELLFTHPEWAYRSGSFAFANPWPLWIWLAAWLIGVTLIAATLQRRRDLALGRRVGVGALQALLLALVLALLWRPVLNVERVRDRENLLAIAVDASASMQHHAADGSAEQGAVDALREAVLPRLEAVFDVRLFAFAQTVRPLDSLNGLNPIGRQTRIGEALTQVLQSAGAAPLAGVILLSDGAENGGTLTEERLEQIASYGVPIHVVGVGPETAPDDLELQSVELPTSAPVGARSAAQVSVRHAGEGKTHLRVYNREQLIAAREIKLPPRAGVEMLEIDLPPLDSGAHTLRFALDALPGERNVVNNTRTRIMSAPPGKRSVLYLEGEPRWEYKFLRRAVERDRALRVASLVRTTPNKHYRQGVESPAELADGFPQRAEELFAYDAVIIGSYEAASLRPAQHELLKQFVDRRGGSVLLLAGRHGLSAGGWQNAPIAQALPVHLPAQGENTFLQRPGQASPTLYGVESSIARIDDDPGRSAERWRALPGLADWQTLGRLKPGAVVLLEVVSERGRAPLLAWQHYGRGAAYVLGTASTLRWQMHLPPEDQTHETFWRQLLHAMAASAPARVTLTSAAPVYDDERVVTLTAHVRNERFEPINDAAVELHIAPEREASFVQTMQPSGRGDGGYTASFDAATPGVYRIDMRAAAGATELGSAVTHVLRTDGVAEHFGAHQHRDVLERIAAITGGRYWSLDELTSLAAAIPYSKAGVVERQRLDLWNLPIVFLVLLALKAAEWALRLRWGRL